MNNNMVPRLFPEIYRKCFGASHDSSQESTWSWLTNQNIRDFSGPAFTRDDLLHMCIMMHEGHRPKMFLWMLEEYVYILGWLCEDDKDGCIVLGHELLLLVCSRCCSKRGGGRGSHCPLHSPLTFYQLAPQTPLSVPCMCLWTPHPWNA